MSVHGCKSRIPRFRPPVLISIPFPFSIKRLRILQPGNCMAFGVAFKLPLQIKLDMPNPTPLSQNIDVSTVWY